MKHDKHIEALLKKAKLITNLGVIVLVFSTLLFLQQQLFPNAFHISKSSSIQSNEITKYDPYYGLDSADIKDGIHLPTGLVVDQGVDVVMSTCAACHSLDLVIQNRADQQGWKDMIVWMQETQKLWDLGESEPIIINYLAKNYAPENTGRRKNLEDIVWHDL